MLFWVAAEGSTLFRSLARARRHCPPIGCHDRARVGLTAGHGVRPVAGVARAGACSWPSTARASPRPPRQPLVFAATLATRLNVQFVTMVRGQLRAPPSVAVWVVFTLQDAVSSVSGAPPLVPAGELPLRRAAKLILLVALSSVVAPDASGRLGRRGGGLCRHRERLPVLASAGRHDGPAGAAIGRGGRPFSTGQTGAAFIAYAPHFLVPLLILAYLDPGATALLLRGLDRRPPASAGAVNIADALVVEASCTDRRRSRILLRIGGSPVCGAAGAQWSLWSSSARS